jgi:hypothetical protein
MPRPPGGQAKARATARGDIEHVRERVSPDPDRLTAAMLRGAAQHHARWRDLTADEQAAAVAELQDLAGGRADLLAEQACILIGARARARSISRSTTARRNC